MRKNGKDRHGSECFRTPEVEAEEEQVKRKRAERDHSCIDQVIAEWIEPEDFEKKQDVGALDRPARIVPEEICKAGAAFQELANEAPVPC